MGVVPLVRRLPKVEAGPALGLSKLWELYEEDCRSRLGASTLRNLRRTRELCAGLPEDVTPGDIACWLVALSARFSETTVQLHRWGLEGLFSWSRNVGIAHHNPVALAPVPKRAVATRKPLADVTGTWPFLLGAAANARERAFLGVLRYAGLRKGEALALTRAEIRTDLTPWRLTVHYQRNANRVDLDGRTERLKTPASKRVLPVREPLRVLLADVLELGEAEVRTGHGGGQKSSSPYLFPFRENDLTRLLGALRGVSPDDFPSGDAWHVFRHTVAVELCEAGRDVVAIAAFLGHTSIAKTQTYLRELLGQRAPVSVIDGLDPQPKSRGGAPPHERRAPRPAATGRGALSGLNTREVPNANPKTPTRRYRGNTL